jgi:hypothetical protein
MQGDFWRCILIARVAQRSLTLAFLLFSPNLSGLPCDYLFGEALHVLHECHCLVRPVASSVVVVFPRRSNRLLRESFNVQLIMMLYIIIHCWEGSLRATWSRRADSCGCGSCARMRSALRVVCVPYTYNLYLDPFLQSDQDRLQITSSLGA